MKKPALIASITAGVILLGGGGYAIGTLTTQTEPAAIETPAPDATPEVTETPVPETSETPDVEYTDAEQELIFVTRNGDLADLQLDDATILDAAQAVCDERDAGLSEEETTTTVPGATDAQNVQFRINAVGSVCVAQD